MRVCIVILCALLVSCRGTPEQSDTRAIDARFAAFVDAYETPTGLTDPVQTRSDLEAFNRDHLSLANQINYDLIEYTINRAEFFARFPLHNFPVNGDNGVHLQFVRDLIRSHPISGEADARNYIDRVRSAPEVAARAIDALQERRKAGIIAPRFTLQRSITQLNRLIEAQPIGAGAAAHPLWHDFNSKLAAASLPAAVTETLRGELRIALGTRYRLAMQDLRRAVYSHASMAEEMGARNLPEGDTWYRGLLAQVAGDGLTPDYLHYIGKEEVARLHTDIERVIAELGYNMVRHQFFLYSVNTAGFYYGDDDIGRQRAVGDAYAVFDDIFPHLETLFLNIPVTMVDVSAVSDPDTPATAYLSAAVNPGSGAQFVINTGSPEAIPVWQLATKTFGATWPGRHLQHATIAERLSLPQFRRELAIPSYEDGWQLYAEYLPMEAGLYQDPWNNYGRLVSELFATAAVVIDTGIHHRQWTVDRATEYARDNLPISQRGANRWVRRMFVNPAHATAAKRGLMQILDLRKTAKTRLGERFDIRTFHEIILGAGPLPMPLLQQRVHGWLAAEQHNGDLANTEQRQ